jgi:hypothetical protein
LGVVIGDDRVGDPKAEDNVLDKAYRMFGAYLSTSLASIHLVNLLTATSKWVKPPCTFLKDPKRSKPHKTKGHVMGMVWSSWASVWIYLTKY